jgi:hypothetical protein
MTPSFPVAWCPGFMVVTSSFTLTHLSITFSNQKFSNCRPTLYVGFVKLTLDNFCGNSVFEMNIQICYQPCCNICVIFRNNHSQCTRISFCECWYSPIDPLRWYLLVYGDVTLETVALNVTNNVAGFTVDSPAKRAPTIYPFSKSNKSPILRFFHKDYHTQSVMHWHEHYRV